MRLKTDTILLQYYTDWKCIVMKVFSHFDVVFKKQGLTKQFLGVRDF